MSLTALKLTVAATDAAYIEKLKVKVSEQNIYDDEDGKKDSDSNPVSGIFYPLVLQRYVAATDKLIETLPFAYVSITDEVRIKFKDKTIADYVNPAITAQMWRQGATGQTPEEGYASILFVAATAAGIVLP